METWCSTLRPPKMTPTWAMQKSPSGCLKIHPPYAAHFRQSRELGYQLVVRDLVNAENRQGLALARPIRWPSSQVDVGDVDLSPCEQHADPAHHTGHVRVLQEQEP